VVPATQRLVNKGIALYGARLYKEWSMVDCISFVVMKEKRIKMALTGDNHFNQAGFHSMYQPTTS